MGASGRRSVYDFRAVGHGYVLRLLALGLSVLGNRFRVEGSGRGVKFEAFWGGRDFSSCGHRLCRAHYCLFSDCFSDLVRGLGYVRYVHSLIHSGSLGLGLRA